MIRRVKVEASEYATFMDFMATTGLRYEEAINSWNLIIQLAGENKLRMRSWSIIGFKGIFIRRTKKAFISFVPKDLINEIVKYRPLTFNVLRKRIQRRRLKLRFGDIRELHASVLTKYLREREIDFLHGRTSTSVFMRNYFNPAWIQDLKNRALEGAHELLKVLS